MDGCTGQWMDEIRGGAEGERVADGRREVGRAGRKRTGRGGTEERAGCSPCLKMEEAGRRIEHRCTHGEFTVLREQHQRRRAVDRTQHRIQLQLGFRAATEREPWPLRHHPVIRTHSHRAKQQPA
eukprot:351882-Chlamydomonas_euryale.AAC.2